MGSRKWCALSSQEDHVHNMIGNVVGNSLHTLLYCFKTTNCSREKVRNECKFYSCLLFFVFYTTLILIFLFSRSAFGSEFS